jgi:hypothetical protein
MRVLCIEKTGAGLTEKRYEHGFTRASEFDLQVDQEYSVYGITLWQGLLSYLLIGEGSQTYWYPAELFRVTQNELPPNWHFANFGQGAAANAIWGYSELVNTEDHFDALANLEEDALKIFWTRKIETDEASR